MEIVRLARSVQRRLVLDRIEKSTHSVLDSTAPPDTSRAEADFEILQARFKGVGEYGYDLLSVSRRAAIRMAEVLNRFPRSDDKLACLDLGTGDGVFGALMAAAGYDVFLCDLRDWRTEAARGLPFAEADCCVSLPYPDASFDLVTSFNAFEHFPDPGAAFAEILRVLRPGGHIYLDFGPLYCSEWGLHAYRTLRMPYSQFLFSDAFITTKLSELGMSDLGEDRTELQFVNRWKAPLFTSLWDRPDVRVIEERIAKRYDNVGIVREYPGSFRGRGLRVSDLISHQIVALLQKVDPTS